MSTTDTGYQGWANYPTWLTALWIDNTEADYRYWRDAAREALTEHDGDADQAAAALAVRLRDALDNADPLAETADLYTDLLRSALADVDVHEIASAWVEEVKG